MRRRRSQASKLDSFGSATIFAALGDKVRLRLVKHLCDRGPASITKLTAGSGLSRQAITKHLRLLETSGLVRSTRHGRESVWSLSRDGIEDARQYIEIISKQWDSALGRLRDFVER